MSGSEDLRWLIQLTNRKIFSFNFPNHHYFLKPLVNAYINTLNGPHIHLHITQFNLEKRQFLIKCSKAEGLVCLDLILRRSEQPDTINLHH